ncbi:MAG: ABC transporter ATP-binding protein, partial [Muribaculaceae bacterium]|nr:ABC transporter ATP-binding protein [Muribaculaceae bacterium]
KQAIKDFDGTVIVVSHDREFLDGLVEKVYEFGGGKVRECLGGIYEFLEKKKLASLQELERKTPAQPAAKTPEPTAKEQRKLSYEEKKERDRTINRAEKKVKEAEAEISRIEGEIAALEEQLASGAPQEPDVYDRHAALGKKLDNAMSLWELASMDLEELKEKYGIL